MKRRTQVKKLGFGRLFWNGLKQTAKLIWDKATAKGKSDELFPNEAPH